MPEILKFGDGRYALATLVLGQRLQSVVRRRARASWIDYCRKHGFDLVVFEQSLDDSPRSRLRSAAWQKCLVADHEALKPYAAVCWIDADIIINVGPAPSVFAGVPAGAVGAVEAWASPDPTSYRKFLEYFKQRAEPAERANTDDDAAAYYARFGLPARYPTVVQSGVLVFEPGGHGPIFRDVYDRYEDRGAPHWHYEMRPLSYELHRQTELAWLDARFNYSAIGDVVALQDCTWPDRFTVLDKVTVRASWIPLLRLGYRRQLRSLAAALDRAWFLHFAGFRLGLVLAGQLGRPND